MPVKGLSGVPADIQLESLPDPGNRFTLGNVIGTGISGTVYEAIDNQSDGRRTAIKVQKVIPEYENDIKEEYKILKYLASHPNLPEFVGAFYKKNTVWFALELCEGGSVIDLVRGLYNQNKHLSEEQIAFILRETVMAICHLHENHVVHRDVKANNILLTAKGEIKLVDFGLSRGLKNTLDKRSTCLGSPCWMAPELIVSGRNNADGVSSYDNRIDVWALGITALELAEGQAPYEEMHPTRAIFQIVRNPPPTFKLPSKWSQFYADFVSECLVKLPEERPFIFEFLDHPFIKSIPEKSSIGQELVSLKNNNKIADLTKNEIHLRNGRLQKKICEATEAMVVEDLAAVDKVTEDKIMNILHERFKRGLYYTYIGDILIFVNPNAPLPIYGSKYHCKYQWKSRSDNSPHIYAVADVAYQDMLHHKQAQNVILSGETLSGKTVNYNHLLDHLLYLGKISNKISDKIVAAATIVQTLGNAGTPQNNNSTRHLINSQVTYTSTGKLSGAIFYLYQLEKWRVTGYKCPTQGNFHIFYYFYDSVSAKGLLKNYYLESKHYHYLPRNPSANNPDNPGGSSNEPAKNAEKYNDVLHVLEILEFEPDQIEIVQKILAAIILIGEISFGEANEDGSEVLNPDIAANVAKLLEVDEKKFVWALCNYCIIQKGTAIKKKHSVANAIEAQGVLARGLYARLVDFIVNVINLRLSVTRVVLGDKNFVSILDLPGFETFEQNNMEQLFINSTNEQLQYFYNQRIFTWELKEQEEEGILLKPLQFYDNKPTIDELLSKPDGFMYVIDEASRSNSSHSFIIDALANCPRGTRIRKATSTNFTVAHYCKKVEYNAQDIPKKNHDFLPPEMIETLRCSSNFVVKQLFTNQLTKSGNLTISTEQNLAIFSGKRKKWGAALVSGDQKSRKFNTEAQGEYSQTRRMRTCASVYRASSLELLKLLSETENSSISFVRCIRGGLPGSPGFEADIVSPQLRSLSILDTTRARQVGYSYHVSFKDFIERYKFLAFDFEENVEITRENCRLLLIRLKMEGWIIGKNKVFLRYYDKEFLSRLYETQVKKIVKIQAVMRKFITKRKVIPRVQSQQSIAKIRGKAMHSTMDPNEAAVRIQKNFKGYELRKKHPGLLKPELLDRRTAKLAKLYARKWKSKTIFQVLLMYRAKMFQESSNFSQQVHLYNQHVIYTMTTYKRYEAVGTDRIDKDLTYKEFIGEPKQIVFRLPFQLNHRSNYTTDLDFDPFAPKWKLFGENKDWDAPFNIPRLNSERQHVVTSHILNVKDRGIQADLLKNDFDNDEVETNVVYHYSSSFPQIENEYIGNHLKRDISIYSVQNEDQEERKTMTAVNTYDGYRNNNFTRVFMQLMCPSCCGGLFSETKGSVYMKRPSTRKSKTTSTVTTISEAPINDNDSSNDVAGNENENEIAIPVQKQEITVINESSELLVEDKNSPENQTKQYRSMSLGDTISHSLTQELNQNLFSEGEIISWNNKLRKTSLHVPEKEEKKIDENTVIELKIRGKEHVQVVKQNGNDDPPFNFQAILRKTNNRLSLKRTSVMDEDEIKEKYSTSRRTSIVSRASEIISDNYFSTELFPGITLEGVVYDL